jgi:hypothetical protein
MAAVMGRHVLASLSTTIVHDPGDPLLTAAILHWNAHHLPWTDAWWQLPIFYPVRDAMAFSEHLLGISVLAAPIDWLTGDPLLTYNVTTLLTFPLSAAAMFLLVYRLTRSTEGAFVAGLAYGFAPFRMSHLPHIQMLAVFWAPLALLGLHAFVESGRRRWLLVYGAAWLLQAAANGYALVYFSLLVGVWVLWFVVARGRWRELLWIAATTVLAALPLVPILATYVAVHARHGFVRSLDEIFTYSADVGAILCATPSLTFWGWLNVACRAEGELFPGVALFALSAAALLAVLGVIRPVPCAPSSRVITIVRRLLFAAALVYAIVTLSVLVRGPWEIEWGSIRATSGSVWKPLRVMLVTLTLAFVLSPRARAAARRSSTVGFYLLAAMAAWLFALGPNITYLGVARNIVGPYTWLMTLPGGDSLRVPARFWLIAAMCLAVVAGLFVAGLLAGRSRRVRAMALLVLGLGIGADGWTTIDSAPAPPPAPDPRALRGQVVMEWPMSEFPDIAAQWRAVTGGWWSINGYSGWRPGSYWAVVNANRLNDPAALVYFRRAGDVHVIVDRQAPQQIELVSGQAGAVRTAENEWAVQFRLPQQADTTPAAIGAAIPIVARAALCDSSRTGLPPESAEERKWPCSPGVPQQLVLDLGAPATVAAFAQGLGQYTYLAPGTMAIETSPDRRVWTEVFNGSTLMATIDGAVRVPSAPLLVVPFRPHAARYVRVSVKNEEWNFNFVLAKAAVHSPPLDAGR